MENNMTYIDAISFDTVSGDHVFSNRFEERQKKIIEKVKDFEYRNSCRKWQSVVAGFAILLCLSGGIAGAAELFKVENLLIGNENTSGNNNVMEQDGTKEQNNVVNQDVLEVVDDRIALGIPGSAEWKASQEWVWFCDKYEKSYQYQEGLLKADEDSKNGIEMTPFAKYADAYGIYTQEMADKLEEICEKYELTLLGEQVEITSYDELLETMQMDNFLSGEFNFEPLTAYSEGVWSGDFDLLNKGTEASWEWGYIYVSRTGFLVPTTLQLGDLSDYEEWKYTNQNGDVTNIMINNVTHLSYIFYKGENGFVMVAYQPIYTYCQDGVVMDNLEPYMWEECEARSLSKEEIQKVADTIQFSNIINTK